VNPEIEPINAKSATAVSVAGARRLNRSAAPAPGASGTIAALVLSAA
jgi:hypothetical protein